MTEQWKCIKNENSHEASGWCQQQHALCPVQSPVTANEFSMSQNIDREYSKGRRQVQDTIDLQWTVITKQEFMEVEWSSYVT